MFNCWKHLLGEDEGLDCVDEVGEEDEDGEVLDPAPLEGLPEARRVEDGLWGIVEVELQLKAGQSGGAALPQAVAVLKPWGLVKGTDWRKINFWRMSEYFDFTISK